MTAILSAWEPPEEASEHDKPHSYRTSFERDRDRILHSTNFRRLAGKTQIFLSTSHDHVRNRLTHTLEVAQIARTIARQLKLDEVLTEAIALGHDLGHTPFGHVGERKLHEITNGCDDVAPSDIDLAEDGRGFKHNHQGVRVVSNLLRPYSRYVGLGLTSFTKWGILNHTGRQFRDGDICRDHDANGNCRNHPQQAKCRSCGRKSVTFYHQDARLTNIGHERNGVPAWSFEGLVVAVADEIAQRHHDIEDGILAQIISKDELINILTKLLPSVTGLEAEDRANWAAVKAHKGSASEMLPYVTRFLINYLVSDVIRTSSMRMKRLCRDYGIAKHREAFREVHAVLAKPIPRADGVPHRHAQGEQRPGYAGIVGFSDSAAAVDSDLSAFLKDRILQSFPVQRMDGAGSFVIRKLFKAFMRNPQQLPDRTIMFAMRAYNAKDMLFTDSDTKTTGDFRNQMRAVQHEPRFANVLLRTICDHIAGMTDDYAFREYQELYGSDPLRSLNVF